MGCLCDLLNNEVFWIILIALALMYCNGNGCGCPNSIGGGCGCRG